jgi:phenylpropionate dioxygenase-like ring-hydroxylating dioxygenase large terminal subunit
VRQIGPGYPTGWFQVGWSAAFCRGAVQPIRYFGQDLVMYRGEGGNLSVLDAFCPHQGAHLGFGGQVEDEDLRCPFHGWRWGGDGRNTEIPYGDLSCLNISVRSWDTREINGLVLVWHDALRRPPTWEPPAVPEASDPAYYPMYPDAAHRDTVRFPPQCVVENNADLAHVRFVHRWQDVPVLDHSEAAGPCFSDGFTGTLSTAKGDVTVKVDNQVWGIGLNYSWFTGLLDTAQVVAVTPIDSETSEMFHSVWARRVPGDLGDKPRGLARAIIDAQFREGFGPSGDRPIFEHQQYVRRVPFLPSEGPLLRAARQWSKQFYPDGEGL